MNEEQALKRIKARHIYYDRKSLEKTTGKIKPKYKLAGFWSRYLDETQMRRFFVGTSQERRIPSRELIELTPTDYEHIKPNFVSSLGRKNGRYALRRNELIDATELALKMNDSDNGFFDVATVSEKAFRKFTEQTGNLQLRYGESVSELKELVKSVVEEEAWEQELARLHLFD